VPLGLPLVWSDAHRAQVPGGEVWIGLPIPGDEVPERAEAIRAALVEAGAPVVDAAPHEDAALLAVHDAGLVDFLRGAWDAWETAGHPRDHGQDRVVPYIFPTAGLLGPLSAAAPAALSARTGAWAFDTLTPVGPGTWQAARAAVDCALTACDLVLGGGPAAYACTRPPGHHVTRAAYGGSCYLNSAAVAAQYLRENGAGRVAIVDVDAHHGNGAQDVFWARGDVVTCSVHVDPGAGWFPHFLGFGHERGDGAGEGANLNVTLAPGTGDGPWLEAVERLAGFVRGREAEALVVALGVDAAAGDPESPLRVTAAGFRHAGAALGRLGLPTVLVQEGGYDLATLGGLVLAVLTGFEEGREERDA
jgi:acetoin utilization deacetylase AcuC-like enzyme